MTRLRPNRKAYDDRYRAEHRDEHRVYVKKHGARPDAKRRRFETLLALRYHITVEDYARLELAQGRCCPGCLKPLSDDTHVDHCHQTGLVRGLLCNNCNGGMGYLRDDPAILRRLAAYLVQAPGHRGAA